MNPSYNYTVYSNTLYIFESLLNEEKTGKWLYEDLVRFTYVSDIYQMRYIPFESKKQFLQELENIKVEIKTELKLPTIHIEAHGDTEGFEIAQTKEDISWRELNDELSEINFLCRNNLILSLGICNGHYINLDMIKFFEEERRCPFIVNISPQETIDPIAIKFGFSNFYQSLLQKREFSYAMKDMEEMTSLNFLTTADILAYRIVEFVKEFIGSQAYTVGTSEQLKELIKKGKQLLPNENFNSNMKALKRYKMDFIKKELKRKWNIFLMVNDFEENKTKFEDFEKIWN